MRAAARIEAQLTDAASTIGMHSIFRLVAFLCAICVVVCVLIHTVAYYAYVLVYIHNMLYAYTNTT